MATAPQPQIRHEIPEESFPVLPPTDLPYDDGIPLETNWHRLAMNLLLEIIAHHFRDRVDYYASGNMFLYYSLEQIKSQDFRGPDFFFVWDVDLLKERKYWAIWDEDGKYPDVIIELMSDSTKKIDRVIKKEIYSKTFRTSEYFIYDPATDTLEGWRITPNIEYEPIPANEKGWLWCNKLKLWLGSTQSSYLGHAGIYPRFFDEQGNLVPIFGEYEKQRADAETQRADTETQRADAEAKRAQAAEEELARLQAKLAELEKEKPDK